MLVSIGNVCNFVCLATPTNLEKEEIRELNDRHPFTHYMVCQIDRLRIKNESIKHGDEVIEFTICQQRDEFNWHEHAFHMSRKSEGAILTLSVDGKSVVLESSDGGKHCFETVFLFLDMVGSAYGWHKAVENLLMLDVQYIGKTEIKEGYLRFKGHEKINKVANEIIENRPNKEIVVKLLCFQKPFTNAMIVPEIDSDDERDDWYPGGGLIENLPINDWKSSVEGALIKYFQPGYNVHYKDNYPSERHTSYTYLYENNIRSIFVELHEEYMAHTTGNENVPYTRIRMIQYPLSKDDSGVYLLDNANQEINIFA